MKKKKKANDPFGDGEIEPVGNGVGFDVDHCRGDEQRRKHQLEHQGKRHVSHALTPRRGGFPIRNQRV